MILILPLNYKPMNIKTIIGVGVLSATLFACTTNPITGRKTLQLVSNSELNTAALQQYQEALKEAKVITGTAQANSVKNVGNRIKNAATAYYKSIGREADLQGYAWEFNLLQDNQLNAWCMPGGKVAVYTGILPVTKDDTGLAVVMGHEVSHALAGHGNERITSQYAAQYGGAILGGTITNSQWGSVFEKVYPVGAQVALLKYGRNQELEADQMGLYLMAMAGYDPRQAQPFWQRMEAAASGGSTPEFLSTHPSPDSRRQDIEKNLPKALEYYKAAGGK